MKPIIAWNISLDCECPYCEFDIDLMDQMFEPGEKGRCELGEHGTDTTRDMEVYCPQCDAEFKIDLDW